MDMKTNLVIAMAAVMAISCLQAQHVSKPNIVVIIADDLGYADVGFNDGWTNTPHLNELAKDGLRFTDFHSSGTVCSPTRAGIMTGQYQQRVGVPGVIVAFPGNPAHGHGLSKKAIFFPALLKEQGYSTGLFGKWHLGYSGKFNPIHYGFDEFRGYLSGQVDYHSHIDLAGSFDWWDGLKKTKDSGYTTHLITKQAISFIRRKSSSPFCVIISHQAVHNPYQGPEDGAFRTEGTSTPEVPATRQLREKKETFKLMMKEMDEGVGEVRAVLKELGLEENTFIFFLSDNGGVPAVSSNAPFRGGKSQVWEGGHRVPAVACWPGKINPGSSTHELAFSLDLMPTILDITSTSAPKGYLPDGISLAGLLREKRSPTHRTIFWHMQGPEFEYAVRRNEWKLVGSKKGTLQLFDLSKDKGEKEDIASGHPGIVKDLQDAYLEWRKDLNNGL